MAPKPESRVVSDRICRKTGSNVVVDYDLNEPEFWQITCYGCGRYVNVDTRKIAIALSSNPHEWGCVCEVVVE